MPPKACIKPLFIFFKKSNKFISPLSFTLFKQLAIKLVLTKI